MKIMGTFGLKNAGHKSVTNLGNLLFLCVLKGMHSGRLRNVCTWITENDEMLSKITLQMSLTLPNRLDNANDTEIMATKNPTFR